MTNRSLISRLRHRIRNTASGKALRKRSASRRRLVEQLEDRRLLATFNVTTVSDVVDPNDGFISLREAITTANTNAEDDQISFAPSLTTDGPATIELTGGQFEITQSVEIVGPRADLLTIDAISGSRIFLVADTTPGDADDPNFTLRGITLTGGDSTSHDDSDTPATSPANPSTRGGSIFAYTDGLVQLDDVVITGSNSPDDGAAILRWGRGDLVINRSQITGNTSGDNGAIYARGETDGFDTFTSVQINDSTISGNTATDKGGAVLTRYAGLNVVRSTISGNTTTRDLGTNGGGGIYTFMGDITVVHSTISGNESARDGGGIKAQHQRSSVNIIGSTISGNESARHGGGIYTFNGAISLTNVTVAGNTAGDTGGGINGLPDGAGSSNAGGRAVVIRNSIVAGNAAADSPDVARPRAIGDDDRLVILSTLIGDNTGLSFAHLMAMATSSTSIGKQCSSTTAPTRS